MTISSSVGSNQPSYPRSEGEASSRIRSRPPGHFAPTSFSRAGSPLVTWPATKRLHFGSSWKPSSSSDTPATSTTRSSVRAGSRSETTAHDPPSGDTASEEWVVSLPCSVLVKSSLVESKVIDDGATTSTRLRPESPTP